MIVGFSVENRAIEAFGEGDVLVFGGIHGDEIESVELCRRFTHDGAIVVPAVNPDGLVRNQKNNARDVDLNRNFAAKNWQLGHPEGYDPGPTPQSEPEVTALVALIDRWQPRALVAVHQPFRCVNWDGSGQGLADQMAAAYGYPSVATVGYPTPGSFGSRYGVDEGRAVVTLELPRPVPDGDWDGCLEALRCSTIIPPAG